MHSGNAVVLSGHESIREILGPGRENDNHFVAVLHSGRDEMRIASFAQLRALLDDDDDQEDDARKVFARIGRNAVQRINASQVARQGPSSGPGVVIHQGRVVGAVNVGPRNRARRSGKRRRAPGHGGDLRGGAQGSDTAQFSASTRMRAPSSVKVGDKFEVVVGLGQATGAADDVALADMPSKFELDVQIGGSGFRFPGRVSHRLQVYRDDPADAETTFTVIAEAPVTEKRDSTLIAAYVYRGALIGTARCTVSVGPGRDVEGLLDLPPEADPPAGPDGTQRGSVSIDAATTGADLTLTILQENGHISFRFASRHPQVQLPDRDVTCRVSIEESKHYGSRMRDIANVQLREQIQLRIENLGKDIAKLVLPSEFWNAVRSIWTICARTGTAPTLLLITEDPYIPWELAWLPASFEVPGVSPDDLERPLSAAWHVGRWLIPGIDAQTNEHLFAPTPATTLSVSRMTVVTGGPGSGDLPQADAEALDLTHGYEARSISGLNAVVVLLSDTEGMAQERPQILHFAMHGMSLGVDAADATALVFDSRTRRGLSAGDVESAPLLAQSHPMVFLNACQTGVSGELLGQYAGLPAAFITAGATGCVAPLWNVNDEAARAIANLFYDQTLTKDRPVGEVMSAVRTWSGEPAIPITITPYSYVFFGHPQLLLTDEL